MSDPEYPLAEFARVGHEQLAAGATSVEFSELRPRMIAEIACWPGKKAALEERISPILGTSGLPVPGRAIATTSASIIGVGPGRFQIIGHGADLAPRLEEAMPAEEGAFVDLTHARAGIRLAGHSAADVLQKGLALDLDIGAFPDMSVAQSAIHHMSVTVIRREARLFDVFVFRGFAVSLWEWLTDAALEFGWRVGAPDG